MLILSLKKYISLKIQKKKILFHSYSFDTLIVTCMKTYELIALCISFLGKVNKKCYFVYTSNHIHAFQFPLYYCSSCPLNSLVSASLYVHFVKVKTIKFLIKFSLMMMFHPTENEEIYCFVPCSINKDERDSRRSCINFIHRYSLQ